MLNRIKILTVMILCMMLVGCGAGDESPSKPTMPPPTNLARDAVSPMPAASEELTESTDPLTPTEILTPDMPTPIPAENIKVVIEIPGVILPPGFSLTKFIDIKTPTGLTFDQQGRLLVTSRDNRVYRVEDADGDGRGDEAFVFDWGYDTVLGVAVEPGSGDIYVSHKGRITRIRDTTGNGRADEREGIIGGLPANGLHQNNNLKFGPDGLLYIGIGSTCNICVESDPRNATISRIDVTTKQLEVVATAIRNPYDLAFYPETGDLFATDNGRDDLGEDDPPEELNHIIEGGDYGWFECWGDLVGECDGTIPAVTLFEPRSSVNSIDFYRGGSFPDEYDNVLFATVFGSWIADVDRGIWMVRLTPDGDTYQSEIEWFARFPDDSWLLGLIVGPDGALYFGDYVNGGVYRISYGVPSNGDSN